MSATRHARRGKETRPGRKERKSFTLSRESIALLDELRASRQGASRQSTSAVLDDLLRTFNTERRRRAVELAVAHYYDSLSEQARAEDNQWAEFALAQLGDEEP